MGSARPRRLLRWSGFASEAEHRPIPGMAPPRPLACETQGVTHENRRKHTEANPPDPPLGRAAVLVLCAWSVLPAFADTIHVAPCGDDAWTGASPVCEAPDGPKRTIQAGIDSTLDGDTVLVADGTYTGDGNRDIDFGGRAITVRSENGRDACIIDCEATKLDRHRAFLFQSGETAESVLEGFTVQNGVPPFDFEGEDGGAVLCRYTSPVIRGCTFQGNGGAYAGGVTFSRGGHPTMIDCTFQNNQAYGGGANFVQGGSLTQIDCTFRDNTADSLGGAIHSTGEGRLVLTNCTFLRNRTNDPNTNGGGAVSTYTGNHTVSRCSFIENETPRFCGGLWINWAQATVTDCTFFRNAAHTAGGMVVSRASNATVANCLFTANRDSDDDGGSAAALWIGDGQGEAGRAAVVNCTFSQNASDHSPALTVTQTSHADVANCILWGNDTPMEIALTETATIDVSYSTVQGGWEDGLGNIDADPLFANPDPDAPDFHVAPGSLCIDAADNTAVPPDTADLDGDGDTAEPTPLDLAGRARFVDDPASGDTGVGQQPSWTWGRTSSRCATPTSPATARSTSSTSSATSTPSTPASPPPTATTAARWTFSTSCATPTPSTPAAEGTDRVGYGGRAFVRPPFHARSLDSFPHELDSLAPELVP
jgi:predicted outer membrane repeat protein